MTFELVLVGSIGPFQAVGEKSLCERMSRTRSDSSTGRGSWWEALRSMQRIWGADGGEPPWAFVNLFVCVSEASHSKHADRSASESSLWATRKTVWDWERLGLVKARYKRVNRDRGTKEEGDLSDISNQSRSLAGPGVGGQGCLLRVAL